MAKGSNYEIKTTIAIDGEKAFKAAMEDANRAMRVHNADLRAMAAEYEYTDDKQRYFAQRAELVGEKLKQQEMIVEALQRAVKESADMYGDAARQTDSYRIQLSNATAKLFDMRKEAENANEELEELGRDSTKIGRQIDRGIGDAAEDAGEKLDSMFERVQKDVNALKTSVGFQVATEVGSFIVNAVQGVTGFVEENQELNRQMAIAKYNIEKYDFDWTKSLELVTRAAAITGNQEGALEAINNLVSTQVTNEELIEAAMEGILGVYLTTGGALSLESLAEDLRASVASKKPTGTYAEVLEELIQGLVIEDVEKALGATKSAEEALQVAVAYLTQAGYQTTAKTFEEQNADLLENLRKQQELAIAWAALATEIQPVVTGIVSGTTTLVEGIKNVIDVMNGIDFREKETEELNKAIEEFYTNPENEKSFGRWWADFWGITPDKYKNNGATNQTGGFEQSLAERSLWEWLFPSAGAETLPGGDSYEAGFKAMQQYNMGLQEAADAEVTAAQAAVATTIAQMQTEEQMAAAFEAGRNAMIAFGNGIAEGAAIPINNVASMVNQINAMLAQIATPAFGLGYGGISGGNIYMYTQQRDNARNVSRMIGNRVNTKMLVK